MALLIWFSEIVLCHQPEMSWNPLNPSVNERSWLFFSHLDSQCVRYSILCHFDTTLIRAIHSGCRMRDTWYLNHSVQQNSAGHWGINCMLTTSQIGCSLQVTSIKTYQTSTFCKLGILPKSGSISSKSDRLSTHWIPTYRSERALAWTWKNTLSVCHGNVV
jgi:hypothetical protein